MLFIEPSNGNGAKRRLHVTIQCYDGSKIHAVVDDLVLRFETTLGGVKIALSAIERLKRVGGPLISSREIMDANKFRITCEDGSEIVGVPRSPSTIHVQTVGSLQAHGRIKMVDPPMSKKFQGARRFLFGNRQPLLGTAATGVD